MLALRVGVMEEFLLFDPVTGRNRAVADKVLAALPDAVRDKGRTVSLVADARTDLSDRVAHLRHAAAGAAVDADRTGQSR